ncbi:trypsin-like peptidase domain-containing protein [Acidisphaera sp. S103]|uniref:trypsin-like peptidase domain-containing protein n=1 Tax=Acidisphaera sp. S103 TaxID=1747223 RepID=UPI00131BD50E|nr:trypsin-like peptidase domain-containing protein [Acidisphaera sp. S103]
MPLFGAFFGAPVRVTIPEALADETSLLTYLNLSGPELKKIWFYRARMYRHFSIAKSSTKVRLISAPDQRLKFLQRQLADKLDELYRPRNPVHGFVADRSVKTNALSHLHRRFLLNIDLAEFFPTITENRVQGLLISLGIDSRVADIIARICCNDGQLPQGAPSSPVLSNMICFRLDKQLMTIAKDTRCIYTRYADDITFSSYQPPVGLFEATLPPSGRFLPDLLTPALRGVIQQNGFVINPEKAHYADRHSRRIVTGLKVNELLNVDRRYVRNIRATLYSVEKLGAKEAEQKFHDSHGGRSSLAAHLQGKIAFLTHIKGRWDPVVRGITLRFNKCFPERALKVRPTPQEIRGRSVWVVENDPAQQQGSAFFLKDVGLVTAAHCVENTDEVEVYHPTKPANKFVARVSKKCEHRDLALLEHSISSTEFLELIRSERAVSQGDPLTAVGYPRFHVGDRLNARPGNVISLVARSGVEMIEVNQTLTQGMSGGPVLNGDDGVVGIIHKGGPGEGRDFAVSIAMLNKWLEEK